MNIQPCIAAALATLLIAGCSRKADQQYKDRETCFLLYDRLPGRYIMEYGRSECERRLPPCSTFKVPLALMAFEESILSPERKFPWDGKPGFLAEWNRNQTANDWMAHSVVWVSRILSSELGPEKMNRYVEEFSFGDVDRGADHTRAWLVSPGSAEPALRINAFEQVIFTDRLWSLDLPVSQAAMINTQNLLVRQQSNGYWLRGKTGSGFYDLARKKRLGWFVGRLNGRGQDLIVVTRFSDRSAGAGRPYGGREAFSMTIDFLKSRGLW
ncbi:MAG: class D beta-lactamase [Spirochaetales bacterium]|nr:class D beta-lactamase [Spirochaetales bacterium]